MVGQVGAPQFTAAGTVGGGPPLVVYVTLQAPPSALVLAGAGGFPGGVPRRPVDEVVCEVGDRLVLSTLFLNDAGVPSQPNQGPWFRISGPRRGSDEGPVVAWTYGDPGVQSDGDGSFSLAWTPQLNGRYYWRVWATGQIERAHVGTIVALGDPSNRNPGTGGPTLAPVGVVGTGAVV